MNAALNLDALYPITLTKDCRCCHRRLPIDDFQMRSKADTKYRDSYCKPCRRQLVRDWRAGNRKGAVDRRHLPPRNEHEKMLDAAFRDWRDIGARGVDLGWRV
jgi:hypothetical protein